MKITKDTPTHVGTYELSLIFHVHRDTACGWCRVGILPGAKKVGRKWLVPTDTLPDSKPQTMGKTHSEPLANLEPMSVSKAWHTVWLDLFRRKR